MQQFSSLLSWCLFTSQHVSGVLPPIISSSMTAVAASGFTFVSWWQLCSWSGRPARPRTQHGCHHDTKGKPEAATAVIELLMMGGRTPETCWDVNKRQDNKLENCCIWLAIYLNSFLDNLGRNDLRWIQSSGMWCQSSVTGKNLAPPSSEQNMEAEDSSEKLSGLSIYQTTRCQASEHKHIHSSRGDKKILRFSLRLINPYSPVASEWGPILLNETEVFSTES